jgi:hypothetical protein
MLMRTPRPEGRSEPDAEHLDNVLDEALRETFPSSVSHHPARAIRTKAAAFR